MRDARLTHTPSIPNPRRKELEKRLPFSRLGLFLCLTGGRFDLSQPGFKVGQALHLKGGVAQGGFPAFFSSSRPSLRPSSRPRSSP